jgi:alpha-glucosidase
MDRKASSVCVSFLLLFVVTLFLTSNVLVAQVSGIGGIESWKKTEDGLKGKTESAFFNVQVYSASVIRVRVSRDKNMDEFSYVLTERDLSAECSFTTDDRGGSIFVRTDAIDMEIEKKPAFRVIFRNKQGKTIIVWRE